jgi:hypothetical protein
MAVMNHQKLFSITHRRWPKWVKPKTRTKKEGVAPRKIKAILLDTWWNWEPHCIPSVTHKLPPGAAISCINHWLTTGLALPKCSKGSILGKEQFAWLVAQLQRSDAQIHVIVSLVQLLTSSPSLRAGDTFWKIKRSEWNSSIAFWGVVLL